MDRSEFAEHQFKSDVRPMRLAVGGGAVVVFGVIAAVSVRPPAPVALFVCLLIVLMVNAGLQAARHVFPVGIGPKGLHAYDFWGYYRTVEWEQMQGCHVRSILPGMPYLIIESSGEGAVLTVPRFLENFPLFRELVLQYAPPGNPLSRYLEEV